MRSQNITIRQETVPDHDDIRHVNQAAFGQDAEADLVDALRDEGFVRLSLVAECEGRYPICMEGERACPPEDVGGVWGYVEYLEALADPNHERHEEFFEWRGSFDPEEFDATKTTKQMQRGLPDWRRM